MLEGVVNVLKPPGMSSSDVVTDIRHIFNMKRVGHTGTLDPGAAGVLPICIGRATRLFDYLVDKEKEYIGEITFGIATDTQDSYGAPEGRSDAVVTGEMLMEALPKFTGPQKQTAPLYSALSVDGKKMYKLARQGVEVERKVRDINVPELSHRNTMKSLSFPSWANLLMCRFATTHPVCSCDWRFRSRR